MRASDALQIATATVAILGCVSLRAESARLVSSDPLLPDTVRVASTAVPHFSPAVVDLMFSHDEPLAVVEITLRISSGQAVFDSASYSNSRVPAGSGKWLRLTPGILSMFMIPSSGELLPPGSGLFCRIHISYPANPPTQTIYLDTATYIYNLIEHTTFFTDSNFGTFRPVFGSGSLEILPSCCIGERGNIDHSPDQTVDISDLTTLIDYLFLSINPTLPCPGEADLDLPPDNSVDISDLSRLIDYLYITPGQAALPSCSQILL
jgi:hypothetical protein